MPHKGKLCSYLLMVWTFWLGSPAVCAETPDKSKQDTPAARTPLLLLPICGKMALPVLATSPEQTQTQHPVVTASKLEESSIKPPASRDHNVRLLSERLQKTGKAIESFKSMGVGVTPFERMFWQAETLLSQGKIPESQLLVENLNSALQEQQKSFYANKMQVWRTQQKNLIAERIAARKNGAAQSPSGLVEAGTGLSNASHSVLKKAKGDYKPLIYPIAR